jgi:hypothetical protein
VGAPIDEDDSRAGDRIFHGARHKHLARAGEGTDPRADADGDSADAVRTQLDLAGVDSSPYFEAESCALA